MVEAMLGAPSLAYAESFHAEDEVLVAARARAAELGCVPIGPAGGAMLRLLAATIGARAVVEVGTGAGVSGLWLLRGMRPDGVLTTVDVEVEHQRAAREAFTDEDVPTTRYRIINGSAAEVLPRLTDAAYDLVFVDADKSSYATYHEQAVRLLRPGGIVAFDDALWHDRVAETTARDAETVTIRETGKAVRDDPRLISAMLPVGDGLLTAVKL